MSGCCWSMGCSASSHVCACQGVAGRGGACQGAIGLRIINHVVILAGICDM